MATPNSDVTLHIVSKVLAEHAAKWKTVQPLDDKQEQGFHIIHP